MPDIDPHQPPGVIHALSKSYAFLILAILGLAPSFAITYLHIFPDPTLRFENHAFHEFAIAVSTLQSGFIAYVTWRCYLRSGEALLRWLTLGFVGFTVIYAMHGVFTRLAHDNVWLFILYGPASRLVMAACLLAGLLAHARQADSIADRHRRGFWLAWFATFVAINVLVFTLAGPAIAPQVRILMEGAAMCLTLLCVAVVIARTSRSPLMTIYALSLLFFAQTSVAFLLGSAWSHMWWLAHAVFAAGFMALSYGVIQAFLTTGSFATVYSLAELLKQIRAEKERTEGALLELQTAHKDLEVLASTDALTGAANRREFTARATLEIARARRRGAPISFLALDLDHFKQINDRHGHQVGDEVLKAFVAIAGNKRRASDLIGRMGGEEFAVMLPDTTRAVAATLGERLRQVIEQTSVDTGDARLQFTASLGVAQYGIDGDDFEAVLDAADTRMYQAKHEGRNKVVGE